MFLKTEACLRLGEIEQAKKTLLEEVRALGYDPLDANVDAKKYIICAAARLALLLENLPGDICFVIQLIEDRRELLGFFRFRDETPDFSYMVRILEALGIRHWVLLGALLEVDDIGLDGYPIGYCFSWEIKRYLR